MQEFYNFNLDDYDYEGVNNINDIFFLETIALWESDFHEKFYPFYANYLFSNFSTMTLINNCLDGGNKEKCGMELINGEIDFDKTSEIDRFSKYEKIYGLGSALEDNKDEPLLLIIDEKTKSGTVILKYISDIDDDYIEDIENPVVSDKQKIKI